MDTIPHPNRVICRAVTGQATAPAPGSLPVCKQMAGGARRRIPRNPKAAPLLLGLGWLTRGQLVRGATTAERHTRPTRRNMPPHSFTRLQRIVQPAENPLEPSTKAKHLQMEAAGSCQENVWSSRPRGQEPRQQEGWLNSPDTHALHSQSPIPGSWGRTEADGGPWGVQVPRPQGSEPQDTHGALGQAGFRAWHTGLLQGARSNETEVNGKEKEGPRDAGWTECCGDGKGPAAEQGPGLDTRSPTPRICTKPCVRLPHCTRHPEDGDRESHIPGDLQHQPLRGPLSQKEAIGFL